MVNLIGRDLGRYHILDQLGEGGMATVYKAFDTRLETDVAVKVIRTDRFTPEVLARALKRFEREAKALARLTHPNIVKVTDFGEYEGQPYLVMPFLPGGNLKQYLHDRKRISWQEAVHLLQPIAQALEFAHSQNVIHRDVKPANILLTQSGQPMLTDFGVAKVVEEEATMDLTGTAAAVGTPEYMAPEQTGKNIDCRVDIYSLGIVFYEMVTGRRPFEADTPLAVLIKQVSEALPRPTLFTPGLPDPVEKFLLKALAKMPADRYQTMKEFSAALEKLLVHQEQVLVKKENLRSSAAVIPQEKSLEKISRKSIIEKDRNPLWKFWLPFGILIVILGISIPIGIGLFNLGTRGLGPLNGLATDTPESIPSAVATRAAIVTDAPTVSPTLATPIEVTFWHAYAPNSAEETALNAVLTKAAIDLPQYEINAIQMPWNDLLSRYRSEVAAGNGPDMIIYSSDSLGDDIRAGRVADISDLAKDKLSEYAPLAVESMYLNGRLYGIPESLKAVSLWYDKSKLATPPTTTVELKSLMQGGTPISISYGCYHYWGFYNAFGGDVFDYKGNISADNQGMIDAMTYLDSLYQISKKNGWPKTDSEGLAPFTEGKVVAIMNGNWAMADYRNALGDRLAVAPLPAGPVGISRPMLDIESYMINPNNPNQAAAVDVAFYLTSKIAEEEMMKAGHVPAITTVNVTDPLIASLIDAFKNSYIRSQTLQLGEYWSNFCDPNPVFEQGMDPANWLRNATKNANK